MDAVSDGTDANCTYRGNECQQVLFSLTCEGYMQETELARAEVVLPSLNTPTGEDMEQDSANREESSGLLLWRQRYRRQTLYDQ